MLQENIVDIFIRYGLFIGAIFQLICIGAVILMPDGKSDYFQESESWSDDEGPAGGSDSGSPTHTSPSHSSRGLKVKRDKKKRRWSSFKLRQRWSQLQLISIWILQERKPRHPIPNPKLSPIINEWLVASLFSGLVARMWISSAPRWNLDFIWNQPTGFLNRPVTQWSQRWNADF